MSFRVEYSLDAVINGEVPEKSIEKAIRKYENKLGMVDRWRRCLTGY